MKRALTTCCYLLAVQITMSAQSTWTNFINDRFIRDVVVMNNTVWVASQGGLTSTQVIHGDFQTYLPENSPLIGAGVNCIERSPDGALWIGTEQGGLFRLQNGEWTRIAEGFMPGPRIEIHNLQILPAGDVWFTATHGEGQRSLMRYRDGELTELPGVPMPFRSFYVLDTTTIYLVKDSEIHHYDIQAGVVTHTYTSDNSILTPEDKLTELQGDRHGTIILPTPQRILQLRDGNLTELSAEGLIAISSFRDPVGSVYFQPQTTNPGNIRLLKYNGFSLTYYRDTELGPYPQAVKPVFVGADAQGHVFASMAHPDSDHSLYRFDGQDWRPVRTQMYPLLSNSLYHTISDCNGNYWFSHSNGMDIRRADGSWDRLTLPIHSLVAFRPGEISVDPVTCDVWIPKNNNDHHPSLPALLRVSNGDTTSFFHGYGAMKVEAAANGRLYFFSGEIGFGYIQHDEVHIIDGLIHFNSIRDLVSDRQGNVYLSGSWAKLILFDGEKLSYPGAGPGGDHVFDLYVDNEDFLWARTSNGLMRYDGESWTDFSHILPAEDIMGIIQDEKGRFWISTHNRGLFYWDGEHLQQYSIENSGLLSNLIVCLDIDPAGNLLASHGDGVTVLRLADLLSDHAGTGQVFFDADQNGVFNTMLDLPAPREKVTNSKQNAWSISNLDGLYKFLTGTAGVHTFQHHLPPGAESTTPNPREAELSGPGATLPAFGFWKLIAPDVEVSLVNTMPVCNWELRVQVDVRNLDVYPTTGSLEIRFPGFLTFLESSLPMALAAPGILRIDALTLEALDIQNIRLTFANPGVEEVGNAFTLECLFQTETGQFTGTSIDTLRCAYDPNDKKVEPTGAHIGDYSLFADPVKYTIRFQNEGNFKAFDVVLIDTLDSRFDPATFELLSASHDVETHISGEGVMTFLFSDIDLPPKSEDEPGSQGHVSFSVQPHKHLSGHEQISNTASIYFDFNPPIVTNTTRWNFVDHLNTVSTQEAESHFALFPNPTSGLVYIDLEEAADYQLWDSAGRLITSGTLLAGRQDVRLQVGPGMYVFRLKNAVGGWAARKLIVL